MTMLNTTLVYSPYPLI